MVQMQADRHGRAAGYGCRQRDDIFQLHVFEILFPECDDGAFALFTGTCFDDATDGFIVIAIE